MNQKEVFIFRNFTPTDDQVIFANTMLEQMMELAPAESTAIATVVRVHGEYKTRFEIFSIAGTFTATAESDRLNEAIKILEEKMQSQISHWKDHRFGPWTSKAKKILASASSGRAFEVY